MINPKSNRKWTPKIGEMFYEVEVTSAYIGVVKETWHSANWETRNVFRTKREALLVAKKIKRLIEASKSTKGE